MAGDEMTEFEVGMKVIIKHVSLLERRTTYNCWVSSMDEYMEKCGTIIDYRLSDDTIRVKFDDDESWRFEKKWLRRACKLNRKARK